MKVYSQDEIQTIADHAFNVAILNIQNFLGQTDGGVAGIYFSGDKEHLIMQILKDYITTEIMVGNANPCLEEE
jgi:hypothetical protein